MAAAVKRFMHVVQVRILCPDVEDNENLNGQLLEMEVASLLDTVSAIKARLAEVLQLPANKQRITRDGVGVLQVRPVSSVCSEPSCPHLPPVPEACSGSYPPEGLGYRLSRQGILLWNEPYDDATCLACPRLLQCKMRHWCR